MSDKTVAGGRGGRVGKVTARVALLPGDGVGPEVTREAVKVLSAAGQAFGFSLEYTEALVGGCAVDDAGDPLPERTLQVCRDADAILFGAVGGPKWDYLPGDKRPEQGILGLRKTLGLFANLRPVVLWPALSSQTPLKAELVRERPDILVVRELTGGLYFGAHRRVPSKRGGGERATDVMAYSTREIERVARVAFRAAQGRSKRLASADKANVLASSRLWRDTVDAVAHEFPDVQVRHLYADNCAMQMVLRPSQFDVLLAENTFGDILSDLGGALAGSLGMLPSASLGRGRKGLYEPVHGSAPDIAGQGIANPLAAILSAAMMLRHTFGLTRAADAIDRAVGAALDWGHRTRDIAEPGKSITGTSEMGDVVASLLAAERSGAAADGTGP